jgi:4,5-dihydroxyphthalate decarboxylase
MDLPASGMVTLKTNLADYPVTMAMKDGRVSSQTVALDFCGPKTAHDAFKAMIRQNEYDAGELAIVTYLQAKAYGKPFVLLPVPVVGRQQHQGIGYDSQRRVLAPKDIEGGKVGVRTYAQTTGLWIRGILQHDYGVDLNKVTWLTLDDAHLAEHQDPANCRRLPAGSKLGEMLLNGELDAAILGSEMPKDGRVKTLIPDAAEAERQWYLREGVIPINHLFVVHAGVAKKRPDVVKEIFRMLVESRSLAPEAARAGLPPIGLEANRKGLQMAIDWSFEQKIIPRRLSVDELFDDTTAGLVA